MKTLTLTQPWATLVAIGAKSAETRSWYTNHRGPIAIHAAKAYPVDCRSLVSQPAFLQALNKGSYSVSTPLPRGVVLCTATLVACVGIDGDDETTREMLAAFEIPPHPEIEFGNYEAGRFAWILKNVVPVIPPLPAKGMLRLWEWNQP